MLFTSLRFLAFLTICLAVYWLLPKRCQWPLLLLFSLYFYYSIARKLLVFVVFAALASWAAALCVGWIGAKEQAAVAAVKAAGGDRQARQRAKRRYLPLRRLVLAAFLCCTLGLLLVFKFYNMAATLAATHGISLPLLRLAMPLGISFYTLMLITYFLDVYHGRLTAQRDPAKVLLYTCFFPQVMQGPISRWDACAPSLFARHTFCYGQFVDGVQRMLWGYFKKLVLADRLQVLTAALFTGYQSYQGFYVVVAALAYTVQLYADFSGGIDIALGVAQLFGVQLPENFNRPFFSKNIAEFWRRWHITLGAFLRDYLFYPLTFSKPVAAMGRFFKRHKLNWAAKWLPTYFAMLIVWFISGVWHGEGLQYVINGLWHGFLITGGETIAAPSARLWKKLGVPQQSLSLKIFRVVRTFCLVAIGEIMFRSENMAMMCGMFRGLFATFNPWILVDGSLLQLGLDGKDFLVAVLATVVLLLVSLASRGGSLRPRVAGLELPLRWGVLLGAIACIAVFGVYGPAYDPTPFIYFQF